MVGESAYLSNTLSFRGIFAFIVRLFSLVAQDVLDTQGIQADLVWPDLKSRPKPRSHEEGLHAGG